MYRLIICIQLNIRIKEGNDNYLLSIYNLQELDYNSRLFRRVLWKKTIFLNI